MREGCAHKYSTFILVIWIRLGAQREWIGNWQLELELELGLDWEWHEHEHGERDKSLGYSLLLFYFFLYLNGWRLGGG
jgi:hypothetical protein